MKETKRATVDIETFYDAILLLNDREQCAKFFEDICTPRELSSMSQRLIVAKLLKQRRTYSEIEQETGASTATISRVNRALQSEKMGYQPILEQLIQKEVELRKKQTKTLYFE